MNLSDITVVGLKIMIASDYTEHHIVSELLFSPLGKLARRAVYFACVNFLLFLSFFNDHSENNYPRICWTNFCNIFTELKFIGCR